MAICLARLVFPCRLGRLSLAATTFWSLILSAQLRDTELSCATSAASRSKRPTLILALSGPQASLLRNPTIARCMRGRSPFWEVVEQRLSAIGLSPETISCSPAAGADGITIGMHGCCKVKIDASLERF